MDVGIKLDCTQGTLYIIFDDLVLKDGVCFICLILSLFLSSS